jgi:hypothetical protein
LKINAYPVKILCITVSVWIGGVVSPSFQGRFSSYIRTFGFIGQFLSPILFAPVFMAVGLEGVFLVDAGVGAAWFFCFYLEWKKFIKLNHTGREAEHANA